MHRPQIKPIAEKLTYREILELIPKALVIMDFDILFCEIYRLKAYVEQYKDEQLNKEINFIIECIKECKQSFINTEQFDKNILENLNNNLCEISKHRGIHNKELYPIFNNILDNIRSIMRYLTESLTFPMEYCLPQTRENMVNFFSEPQTRSKKIFDNFLKEANVLMDRVNTLTQVKFN